jgi:hypothetical protein
MLCLLLLYREIGCGVEFATFGYKKCKIKKASKGNSNPLEASYWILPENPFHNPLQKVKGWVERLI